MKSHRQGTASEFWWSAREVLQGGQLRGLYRDAIIQLCARTYVLKGRKYCIETKEDFKTRIKRSPDDADAVVGLCEVARRNGLTPSTAIAKRTDRDWIASLKEADKFNDETPLGMDGIDVDEDAYSLDY